MAPPGSNENSGLDLDALMHAGYKGRLTAVSSLPSTAPTSSRSSSMHAAFHKFPWWRKYFSSQQPQQDLDHLQQQHEGRSLARQQQQGASCNGESSEGEDESLAASNVAPPPPPQQLLPRCPVLVAEPPAQGRAQNGLQVRSDFWCAGDQTLMAQRTVTHSEQEIRPSWHRGL